jgi:hypothetical protein
VVLVAAFQALKVLTVTVVRVRESTSRTSPRRVLRVYLLHIDTVEFGPVFDVLVQPLKGPFVAP